MSDDFYYYLFIASVCVMAGVLLAMFLQMQFNTGVVLVGVLFNITPSPTVAVATNVTSALGVMT